MDRFFVKKGLIQGTHTTEARVTYSKKRPLPSSPPPTQSPRSKSPSSFPHYSFTSDSLPSSSLRAEVPVLTVQEQRVLSENQQLYTKGFKMLFGDGPPQARIGKFGEGIVEPLAARGVKRLGANTRNNNNGNLDFNQKNESKLGARKMEEKLTVEEDKVLEAIHAWKKRGMGVKPREEVEKKKGNNLEMTTKIVDMRNNRPQIIDSISQKEAQGSNSKASVAKKAAYNPQLLLTLLQTRHYTLKRELQTQNLQKRTSSSTLTDLRQSLQSVKSHLSKASHKRSSLEAILELISSLTALKGSPSTYGLLLECYNKIRLISPSIMKKYNLDGMLVSDFTKILQNSILKPQDVLQKLISEMVGSYYQLVKQIHADTFEVISAEDAAERDQLVLDDMEYVIYRVWLPALKNYCNNHWDHEDPEDLIESIQCYEDAMPKKIFTEVFDQVIIPVLISKIKNWNILESQIYPHLWIHPWFLLCAHNFEERLAGLNREIKTKFRTELRNWSPGNSFALEMLRPWKSILKPEDWEDIVYRDILPKLMHFMEKFSAMPESKISSNSSSQH